MAGCNGDTDMENTVINNDNNTTDNNVNNNLTNNVVDYKASDIVGFYFHERDGMIKLPHYLITKTDNGMFVKITEIYQKMYLKMLILKLMNMLA